jgi:hypothetical protein
MGPMLRELYQYPEKGFLGDKFFLYRRGPTLVQYALVRGPGEIRPLPERPRRIRSPDEASLFSIPDRRYKP